MLARTHRWAGAIGGLVAGPLGLIVIALYIFGRQQVWNVELAIVQCIACPGPGRLSWTEMACRLSCPRFARVARH
jgi:hypothetical protein